jgi:acid phosphatase family membrane protein YuiD
VKGMNNSTIDFQIFGVTGYTVMSNYHLRDKNLSNEKKLQELTGHTPIQVATGAIIGIIVGFLV